MHLAPPAGGQRLAVGAEAWRARKSRRADQRFANFAARHIDQMDARLGDFIRLGLDLDVVRKDLAYDRGPTTVGAKCWFIHKFLVGQSNDSRRTASCNVE